jgi:hypothetical protein
LNSKSSTYPCCNSLQQQNRIKEETFDGGYRLDDPALEVDEPSTEDKITTNATTQISLSEVEK